MPTTPTRGYHETITRFYMLRGEATSWRRREEGSLAERANRLYLRYGDRELPLRRYYVRRGYSAEAKPGRVESDPDLRP